MKIEIDKGNDGLKPLDEILHDVQVKAKRCYTDKSTEELKREPLDRRFLNNLIMVNHHSPFDHPTIPFHMVLPKMLAMVLNNQRIYATSEQSARYTTMADIEPTQNEVYMKWKTTIMELIKQKYPESEFPRIYEKKGKRKTVHETLSMENARYMTSVLTPTQMFHTVNLKHLNYVIGWFEEFIAQKNESRFNRRLAAEMKNFISQEAIKKFRIEGLNDPSGRGLNLFDEPVEEHFGDTYSTNYLISFAAFADTLRHRTIRHMITSSPDSLYGFFVPPLVRENNLGNEWTRDIMKVANDFPQGQLIRAAESGDYRDFTTSKLFLRICGSVQYEVMKNALETAEKYSASRPEIERFTKPRCTRRKCPDECAWGGKMALERII